VYDSEEADDEDEGDIHTMQENLKEEEQSLQSHEAPIPPEISHKKVTIASMSGVPKFNTFKIKRSDPRAKRNSVDRWRSLPQLH
jgi:hypothetical protein